MHGGRFERARALHPKPRAKFSHLPSPAAKYPAHNFHLPRASVFIASISSYRCRDNIELEGTHGMAAAVPEPSLLRVGCQIRVALC